MLIFIGQEEIGWCSFFQKLDWGSNGGFIDAPSEQGQRMYYLFQDERIKVRDELLNFSHRVFDLLDDPNVRNAEFDSIFGQQLADVVPRSQRNLCTLLRRRRKLQGGVDYLLKEFAELRIFLFE